MNTIRLELVLQRESFTGSANDNILPRVAIKAYVRICLPRLCLRADVDAPLRLNFFLLPSVPKKNFKINRPSADLIRSTEISDRHY